MKEENEYETAAKAIIQQTSHTMLGIVSISLTDPDGQEIRIR